MLLLFTYSYCLRQTSIRFGLSFGKSSIEYPNVQACDARKASLKYRSWAHKNSLLSLQYDG